MRTTDMAFPLIALIGLLANLSSPAAGAVRVVFRMDDYCNGVQLETMEEVFSTFQSCSVGLTVGVVPAVATDGNLNSTGTAHSILAVAHGELLARWMKSGVVELAVHGYEHRARSARPSRSEFAGVERGEQFDLMKRGCDLIEERVGIRSRIFFPPWNTFDLVTLQAAASNGMRIVSTLPIMPRERDGVTDGLTFLPSSAGGIWTVYNDLSNARRSGDADPVVVAVFHVDDFRAGRLTIETIRKILAELSRTPDVQITSLAAIGASRQNPTVGDYRRLEEWKALWSKQRRWTPRFLRVDVGRVFPDNVVSSPGHLEATVRRYLLGVWLFFLACAAALVAGVVLAVRTARRAKVVAL